ARAPREVAPGDLDLEATAGETERHGGGLAGRTGEGEHPELLAGGAVIGREEEAVARQGEILRIRGGAFGRDVLHHARAFRRAVGLPELEAVDAVVGGEKEPAGGRLKEGRAYVVVGRVRQREIAQHGGAGGGTVAAPQLPAVAVVGGEDEPGAHHREVQGRGV